MPGQKLFQPNPPPDQSLIPESVLDLSVKLDISHALSDNELVAVKQFRRAADYIAAGTSYSSLSRSDLTICAYI